MESETKARLKEMFWNRWFSLFLIGIAMWYIAWNFAESKTFKICGLFIFSITELLYALKVSRIGNFISKLLIWTSVFMAFLLAFFYTATAVNELNIAIFLLISITLGIFTLPVIVYLLGLWRSRYLYEILLSYSFLVFFIIVLFGMFYMFVGASTGNEIKYQSNSTMSIVPSNKIWDFIYFSGSVFYSSTFGDFVPFGYSRLLAILEVAVSFILHVIVLGSIIPEFSQRRRTS
jgi:hypothetical protein